MERATKAHYADGHAKSCSPCCAIEIGFIAKAIRDAEIEALEWAAKQVCVKCAAGMSFGSYPNSTHHYDNGGSQYPCSAFHIRAEIARRKKGGEACTKSS
jgi:hypothetical protein